MSLVEGGSPMPGVTRSDVGTQQHSAQADAEIRNFREARKKEALRKFFDNSMDPTRYRLDSIMGQGAFGIVCKAYDTRQPTVTPGSTSKCKSRMVAIKRIRNALDTSPMATRVLRELILLRLLSGHDNIISIRDVLVPGEKSSNDAYVVFDLMETDLETVLHSKTKLLPCHHKVLLLQLLKAVAYLFESSVLHRDLKPSNILIDKDCRLKVCDLGLARASFEDPRNDMSLWTDYVATRWYRAPELILRKSALKYTAAIDMWSVGCIFAEILDEKGRSLFPGGCEEQVITLILRTLGRPSEQAIESIPQRETRQFLRGFPIDPITPLEDKFPGTDPLAIDLLKKLLTFDPDDRILAPKALHHPYFASCAPHVRSRKRGSPVPVSEFVFEGMRDTDSLRKQFLQEVARYHPDCMDEVMSPSDTISYGAAMSVENNPVYGVTRSIRSTMPTNYISGTNRMKEHVTLNEQQMRDVAKATE